MLIHQDPAFSVMTLTIGALFGIMFVFTMFVYSKAMVTGPLAYSVFYFSASMVIPVLASGMIWGEVIRTSQWIGIGLFLAAFALINFSGTGDGRKASWQWIIYCTAAFIGNGTLSVLSKWHQKIHNGTEIVHYLLIGFTMAALITVIQRVLLERKGSVRAQSGMMKTHFWLAALATAATTGAANLLIVHLSGYIAGAYLFPVMFGSVVVLTTVLSSLLFKESISGKGMIGIVIGIAAIVVINL